MSGKAFGFVLIGLMVIASIFYALEGDYRRCVYWFAAAVLNWCVTV